MSCYEQFSLSSEIDRFFHKIYDLPTYLRDYAISLVKEHIANPSLSRKPKKKVSFADATKPEFDVIKIDRDPLKIEIDESVPDTDDEKEIDGGRTEEEEEIEGRTDEKYTIEADTAGSLNADGSNTETIDFIDAESEAKENPKDSDSVAQMVEEYVDNIENIESVTIEGADYIVDDSESVPDISLIEEVCSTEVEIPEPISVTPRSKKSTVVSSMKYQVVKRLKRGKNGAFYYENAAVPVSQGAQNMRSVIRVKTPGSSPLKSSPLKSSPLKSSPLKSKRKEAHGQLTYSEQPQLLRRTLEQRTNSSSTANDGGKNKLLPKPTAGSKQPKLILDVGSENQVVLKNSSEYSIAFMTSPDVVVQKPSGSMEVDAAKAQISTPVFLSGDKVVVPAGIKVNTQSVKNKVSIKEINPKTVAGANSSDSQTDSKSIVSKFRTILPKNPNSYTTTALNNEVLREIQFLPNLWGKQITATARPVTVQLSNSVSNNIHMKNKNSVPVKTQKSVKLNSNIAAMKKRILAKPSSARVLGAENDKRNKFILSSKQRETLAKHLSKYLKKNKDDNKDDSDEEFVVVIDPNDVVSTDECSIVEPTGGRMPVVQIINKNKVCEKCGKAFRTVSKLKQHMKSHIPKFKCKKCGESFLTRQEQYLHKAEHKPKEIHTCEFCRIQFAQFIRLKEHIRLNHPTQKLHKCSQCDYTAYTQKTLDSHFRYKHIPKRRTTQLVCPVCRKVYDQTSEYKNHITTHLPERIFKCNICEKSFSQKTTLRSHQRNVHGERRYPCNVCTMVLKTRDNQIRHMASHTDAKLFPCPKCSYACNSQGNLVKHVRTQHHIANFSLRKREQRKPVAKESDPLVDQGVERAQHITKIYLSKLSKKMGRDLTSMGVQSQEMEDSVNDLIASCENNESEGHADNSNDSVSEVSEEQDFSETVETVAAVASLEKQNPFSILPETQKMLDDLMKESNAYTAVPHFNGSGR